MLGLCFLEKGLPQLAVKWYRKGLETMGVKEADRLGLLYALARHAPRPLKRLYRRREEMMGTLRTAFDAARRGEGLSRRAPTDYHARLREDEPARKPHSGLRSHSAFGGTRKGNPAGTG